MTNNSMVFDHDFTTAIFAISLLYLPHLPAGILKNYQKLVVLDTKHYYMVVLSGIRAQK